MRYKDNYKFLGIITSNINGFSIEFPQLPGCTASNITLDGIIEDARYALGLYLVNMELNKETIPELTLTMLQLKERQTSMLIEVNMPLFRTAILTKSVKKTVTIPRWLEIIADENHINYSQILQAGIQKALRVTDNSNNYIYKNIDNDKIELVDIKEVVE